MDHERWSEAQKRTTVVVDGKELEVAYRDEGSGEPVVFLHGIPTWSFLWRQVAPRLEGEFRTIVPDLVGYGNSDRREGFDRSIRAQEQALAGLVEELDLDRFHVVAHDIGGGPSRSGTGPTPTAGSTSWCARTRPAMAPGRSDISRSSDFPGRRR